MLVNQIIYIYMTELLNMFVGSSIPSYRCCCLVPLVFHDIRHSFDQVVMTVLEHQLWGDHHLTSDCQKGCLNGGRLPMIFGTVDG